MIFGGIFLIFGVVLLVHDLIRSAVKQGTERAAVGRVADSRAPGLYKVTGVDRATKMDTVWRVHADSPEIARVKADLEGIAVAHVEREVDRVKIQKSSFWT